LGLKLIRESVELNRGKIQIVSSDGYWEQKQRRVKSDAFEQEFPGTIVNLEFNIDDKSYNKLSSEIAPEDIF
ncbi:MAG: ATP-binding protein, partial [bacterium]